MLKNPLIQLFIWFRGFWEIFALKRPLRQDLELRNHHEWVCRNRRSSNIFYIFTLHFQSIRSSLNRVREVSAWASIQNMLSILSIHLYWRYPNKWSDHAGSRKQFYIFGPDNFTEESPEFEENYGVNTLTNDDNIHFWSDRQSSLKSHFSCTRLNAFSVSKILSQPILLPTELKGAEKKKWEKHLRLFVYSFRYSIHECMCTLHNIHTQNMSTRYTRIRLSYFNQTNIDAIEKCSQSYSRTENNGFAWCRCSEREYNEAK